MRRATVLMVAGISLGLGLLSCGGGGGGGTTPLPPTTLTITTTTLTYGLSGKPYSGAQLQASGGTSPYTWSCASPIPGLRVSSDGKVTGTVAAPANTNPSMLVTVQDSASHSAQGTVVIPIYNAIAIYISGSNSTRSNVPFHTTIYTVPGNSSLKVTSKVVSGALPPGLSLTTATTSNPDQSVDITGTATQSGVFDFTVESTSNASPSETEQATLRLFVDIQPLLWYDAQTAQFANRTVPYHYSVVPAQGGTKPYTYSLVANSGAVPAGISLATDGTLSGMATTLGHYTFKIRVTDSGVPQQNFDSSFSMDVFDPLTITVGSLPDATTGESYSAGPFTFSGGRPPYRQVLANFSICCFTLERHDVSIHGVPRQAGDLTMTLSVSDNIQIVTQQFKINVAKGPFEATPDLLPAGSVGKFYYGYMSSVSGTAPVTWKLLSGVPPPGLSFTFNSTPYFYGYPSTAGVYSMVLEATDSSTPAKVLDVPITIPVYDKLPRNDTPATATNYNQTGFQHYSISPFADPPDVANPDQDYIHVRGFAGETLMVQAAQWTSAIDPVMEIVDANGQRFSTCRNPGDDVPDENGKVDLTPYAFDDSCMNDDATPGQTLGSQLYFRVPGASGTQVDFYVHIVDYRGDARPDMIYSFELERPSTIP